MSFSGLAIWPKMMSLMDKSTVQSCHLTQKVNEAEGLTYFSINIALYNSHIGQKHWYSYTEPATCCRLKCRQQLHRENANHGNNIINNILIDSLINCTCSSQMFSLMVYFIADAILHFQLCTVSHPLSLFLSLRCLALFPAPIV